MELIKCKSCGGNYVIRDGKYSVFAGCSNYPKCKSTIKLQDLALEYIINNGLNIYRWQRVCWKCHKYTEIYSYFPMCDFNKIGSDLEQYSVGIGIGDITYFDEKLMSRYPTIKIKYSSVVKASYPANTCKHCGAMQGRNYVVEDPDVIFNDLYSENPYDNMKKYLFDHIECKSTEEIKEDINYLFDARHEL